MYAGPKYTRLDGLEFLEYLWRHKGMTLAACGIAIAIAGGVSLVLPARYTATSSVLIDTPAGNDPRAATAVSPVYLESLKTYELLASSDTLFERALNDLHIRARYPGASIESLKRRILSLNKPTNTSILEISATLDDPRQAQALAQYLAEHTVQLNAQLDDQSNQEILQEPRRIFEEAVARRARAEKASDEFTRSASAATLSQEVKASEDLLQEVVTQLARGRAELAEDLARQKAPHPAGAADAQPEWMQLEVVSGRARVEELQKQDGQLRDQLHQKASSLESLLHAQASTEAELKAARSAEESAQARLSDVQASSGLRGVRLKVLDPGIVPQRASFPNTPLNVLIAAVFSLAASAGFLTFRYAYARMRLAAADPVYSLR